MTSHRWHHCCTTLDDVRERCRIDSVTGCWHWTGAVTSNGTPRMYAVDLDRSEKRVMPAHRATWMISTGYAVGPRMVYRTCFVNDCVNPAHLRTATTKAEIGAKLRNAGTRKGTSMEQRRASILMAQAARGIIPTSAEIVREIRAAPASVTGLELARRYGMASQTVSRIRRGQSHRNVTP